MEQNEQSPPDAVTVKAIQDLVVPTYRRLKPKAWPDLYYWALVGLAAFLVGEVLVRLNHGRYLLLVLLAGAWGFAFLPLGYLAFFDRFESVMNSLKPVLWGDDFGPWLRDRSQLIFTLHSWKAKLLTGIITFAGVATVLKLGLPLRTQVLNLVALAGFVPLLLICGQGGYMCLALLWVLRDIARRRPQSPFWLMPHPAILDLHAYYGFVGVIFACEYAVLALGIWQGPHGFAIALQGWLAVLAFIPLSLFIWSFLQVHVLLRKVKQQHLKLANEEVQRAWQHSSNNHDVQSTELLLKAMDVQAKIQSLHDWPINVSGTLSFLIAFATAATQSTISWMRHIK